MPGRVIASSWNHSLAACLLGNSNCSPPLVANLLSPVIHNPQRSLLLVSAGRNTSTFARAMSDVSGLSFQCAAARSFAACSVRATTSILLPKGIVTRHQKSRSPFPASRSVCLLTSNSRANCLATSLLLPSLSSVKYILNNLLTLGLANCSFELSNSL